MSLTPEEGTLLGTLADRPRDVTRFTPQRHNRSGYRAFNVDVVWPLEQLRRRGLVAITERRPADPGGSASYWSAIAAELTPEGRDAAAGRPRNSVGEPGIPEG